MPRRVFDRLPVGDPTLGERVFKFSIPEAYREGGEEAMMFCEWHDFVMWPTNPDRISTALPSVRLPNSRNSTGIEGNQALPPRRLGREVPHLIIHGHLSGDHRARRRSRRDDVLSEGRE